MASPLRIAAAGISARERFTLRSATVKGFAGSCKLFFAKDFQKRGRHAMLRLLPRAMNIYPVVEYHPTATNPSECSWG
jgi:hypothetical protein